MLVRKSWSAAGSESCVAVGRLTLRNVEARTRAVGLSPERYLSRKPTPYTARKAAPERGSDRARGSRRGPRSGHANRWSHRNWEISSSLTVIPRGTCQGAAVLTMLGRPNWQVLASDVTGVDGGRRVQGVQGGQADHFSERPSRPCRDRGVLGVVTVAGSGRRPSMTMTCAPWRRRSMAALARRASWKSGCHSSKGRRWRSTMVDARWYRCRMISWRSMGSS
jgi:hypothetical protein